MDLEKFYFTYGSDDVQPYCGGWTEVWAPNYQMACQAFRAVHPDRMQNGIDFENLVTSIVNGHDDPNNPWSWAAGQIAAIIKGGQLQFKSRKTIQVRGMDVVLYPQRADRYKTL